MPKLSSLPRDEQVTQNAGPTASNSDDKAKPLVHAAFAPVWIYNPYHGELARSLAPQGVRVEQFERFKELYQRFRANEMPLQILHLHGLPFFLWRPIDLIRYVVFVGRLLRLRRRRVRIVWTIHDYRNHDNPRWRIEHCIGWLIARRVDALIVHGAMAKQIVVAGWGKAIESRVHIIPHGNYINSYPNHIGREEARRRLGLDSRSRVLLFLGWIRPYKGVSDLIRIFRQRPDRNARLVVAGRPIDAAIDQNMKSLIGEDSRICYRPGFVDQADVQIYMNASDVMVLPYERVFTSGAAVLAMSFGKACIAPKMGGVVDALDCRGAVMFDPAKPQDLERALTEVLDGRHDLAAMAAHNRARAVEWSWSEVGQRTAAIYRACLDGSIASSGRRGLRPD